MKTLRCIQFAILAAGLSFPLLARRDPFLPIDYKPAVEQPPAEPSEPKPTAKPEQPVRTLTDDELRQLAIAEARRIRQSIQRDDGKATVIMGDRIMTLVNGKLLEEGDSFEVEAYGNRYRLEIIRLTTENIKLRPHRVVEPKP